MALPTKESRWGGLHNGNNQNSLSLARASGKGATTSDYWAPPDGGDLEIDTNHQRSPGQQNSPRE